MTTKDENQEGKGQPKSLGGPSPPDTRSTGAQDEVTKLSSSEVPEGGVCKTLALDVISGVGKLLSGAP